MDEPNQQEKDFTEKMVSEDEVVQLADWEETKRRMIETVPNLENNENLLTSLMGSFLIGWKMGNVQGVKQATKVIQELLPN